jgi:Pex14 N-terminal domain
MTNGSEPKEPSIPAWQKDTSGGVSNSPPKTRDAGRGNPAPDRSALLEQAKKFLEDSSVRGASQEKKAAFLAEKGLQDHEIANVLDKASPSPISSTAEDGSLKTVHDPSASSSSSSSSSSSASPSSATPDTTPPTSSSLQAKAATHPDRDAPPIITYPEFLLRPSKPTPLVTFQRLSYALYTLAGISALTYGASRHLVQPMLESLTLARHDLSNTTLHNLNKMNERLEGNVSHVPALSNSVLIKERGRDRDRRNPHDNETGSDIETIDSDPTELFHRDIATQTSPGLLSRSPSIANCRRASSSSSASLANSSSSTPHSKDATITAATQSRRLTALTTSLSSLLLPNTSTSNNETLLETISDCQAYLDKLQFSLNSYSDYNVLYGSARPINDSGSRRGGADEEDEAMRFRQEIRAVKGALLSVRNFPVGRPATGAAAAGGGGMGVGAK